MDSGYIYVCEHRPEGLPDQHWCTECNEEGKSAVQCFFMTMTPVDLPSPRFPKAIYDRMVQDMLTFGQAVMMKAEIPRLEHGQTVKLLGLYTIQLNT